VADGQAQPMSKRDKMLHNQLKELREHGWVVNQSDAIRFNSGSETFTHFVGKACAAFVGDENGFRVASEVVHDNRGEVDILLYGLPERMIMAVEIETSPTEEVVQDKLERYIHNTPIQEMFVINANDIPMNQLEAKEFVAEELGL